MNPQTARRLIQFFAGAGILSTTAIAIYAAQPWGDNYAYETLSDYLLLAVFVGWAISPYLFLILSTRRQPQQQMQNVLRVGAAFLISLWGIAVLVNSVFINTDAQGALIFLFLPIFQWLIIAVLWLVLALVKAKN